MLIRTRVQVVTRYPDGRVFSAGEGVTSIIDDADQAAVEHIRMLAKRGQVVILDPETDPGHVEEPAGSEQQDNRSTGAAVADFADHGQPEVVGEDPRDELAELRARAAAAGVKVDRRWGADRLQQEIDAARVARAAGAGTVSE